MKLPLFTNHLQSKKFEKKFYKLYKKHKSLNINNPYEDIEEDENQQPMKSDSEIRAFMQKYWTSIRTFTKGGKVQNIFIFFYDRDFKDLIEKISHRIMKYQTNRFKINCSLAFILKNIEAKELRYYHSSFNNAQILETASLISNCLLFVCGYPFSS